MEFKKIKSKYYDHYKYQFDFESNTYTIDKVLDSNVKKKWEISYSSEFAATKIIKKTETLEQAKEYIKKCVQSQLKNKWELYFQLHKNTSNDSMLFI